ncbi:MAG: CMP-binding protein [Planctomycetota bacterium]|nr:MAG: CMP-binding protein [Planctomycetota bacterium]
MSRRFVSQLAPKEQVDQIFLACNKQLRPNRNGNLYLQVQLVDRSGSINGMMWNANDQVYRNFDNGDYVSVTGTAQLYNGDMQLIVTSIDRVAPSTVNEEDFLRVSNRQIDQLTVRLTELLREVRNPHLRNLVDCFLLDEAFMRKFTAAPAAVKNHHAYRGGLLEHVVNMLEVTRRIADLYPQVDAEVLRVGVFLHDVGKIDELSYERDFGYTDEGQLIGHLVMGAGILDAKVREAERLSGQPIPHETVLRIKHMILSHHGSYEFGSPKLPMTLEAVALSHIDDLDAKLHSFDQLMRDDPNVDSAWTPFQQNLSRKLYKGPPANPTAAEDHEE